MLFQTAFIVGQKKDGLISDVHRGVPEDHMLTRNHLHRLGLDEHRRLFGILRGKNNFASLKYTVGLVASHFGTFYEVCHLPDTELGGGYILGAEVVFQSFRFPHCVFAAQDHVAGGSDITGFLI